MNWNEDSSSLATCMLDVNLEELDLSWHCFEGIDMRRARLGRANLFGAHLGGADLRGADLSRAQMEGAWLRGALLHGADLTLADLSQVDLEGARFDWRTRWPMGVDPIERGAHLDPAKA